ncbi:MAG: cobalamin biosynthesis protein CobD [Bacteroidaceae bacterium]|nr:cobalamin biosynthesis protein CobD [Bacteroidaceae bacterium]
MDVLQLVIGLMPLLAGALLDALLGDPSWLPHPVVGFGKLIGGAEKRLNKGGHRKLKGALTAVLLIAFVFVLFFFGMRWLYRVNVWVGVGLETLMVFCFLAGKTLIREVRMVFQALEESLDKGRKQLSRIVGRDTANLDAQEIRTAALETLAENLSDGVIAPLFWYLLLGLPGMAAYKMINTLDSMIGYKTERYKDFGCWAAHIDDVANWIPARLTALLMVLSAGRPGLLCFVHKYGRQHASPNSGFPESALAGILDCRFGGTHTYFGQEFYKPYIGENPRDLTSDDARRAIRINIITQLLMILICALKIWNF